MIQRLLLTYTALLQNGLKIISQDLYQRFSQLKLKKKIANKNVLTVLNAIGVRGGGRGAGGGGGGCSPPSCENFRAKHL